MVPPDFDETMNSARAGSMERVTVPTRSGTVESSTVRAGKPGALPMHCRSTSGPRLLPPMPSSTTSRTPSPRTSSANDCRSLTCSVMSREIVSQPSRSVISVGSSFQTVWSLSQIRATTLSRASCVSAVVTFFWCGPRGDVGGCVRCVMTLAGLLVLYQERAQYRVIPCKRLTLDCARVMPQPPPPVPP